MTLATTASNALRHRGDGLGRVLYWTYTKYPLGESWEAYFPTTIYLVGCNPPVSASLYCTGDSAKKVLYHSDDTCSVTNPGEDYVISYDRRAYCPTDLSAICDNIEEPGEVEVEKTTVPLCITFEGTLISSKWNLYFPPEGAEIAICVGCVEAQWRIAGGLGCTQYSLNAQYTLAAGSDGEMSGNSSSGWSRSYITLSPEGAVSFGGWLHVGTYGGVQYGVAYGGTGGDISLDEIYHCPIGTSVIPVLASSCVDYNGGRACCPEGTMCGGHEYVCEAGEITITTAVKVGSC